MEKAHLRAGLTCRCWCARLVPYVIIDSAPSPKYMIATPEFATARLMRIEPRRQRIRLEPRQSEHEFDSIIPCSGGRVGDAAEEAQAISSSAGAPLALPTRANEVGGGLALPHFPLLFRSLDIRFIFAYNIFSLFD